MNLYSTHVRTVLHVNNIHCQSCVDSISEIITKTSALRTQEDLENLEPLITDVDISIASRSVSFTHPRSFGVNKLLKQLEAMGFEVSPDSRMSPGLPIGLTPWRWFYQHLSQNTKSSQRETTHRNICKACNTSGDSSTKSAVKPSQMKEQSLRETRVPVDGVTWSSSTSSIATGLSYSSEPGVLSCRVAPLPPPAVVVHDVNLLSADDIRELAADMGYGAEVLSSEVISPARHSIPVEESKHKPISYKVIYSIPGMTCASCVSSVTGAINSVPGIIAVSVDLIGNTGSVVVKHREDAELVQTEVEGVGFECTIVEIMEQYDPDATDIREARTVSIRVDGMFDSKCVEKVNQSLESLLQCHAFGYTPISLDTPAVTLTYIPEPPAFTLRHIRAEIASLGFTLSVVHVDTIEERAARARAREQRDILLRLGITLLIAIPTFVIAVVGMSLLPMGNAFRAHLETPVWGNSSRGTVALFVLSTPVQFGVGWYFHIRSWKSLKGVWRKRRADADWKKVWLERMFRWGSMDTLVALGTFTGYFASLALMILDVRTTPQEDKVGGEMGWFDNSVFLMLFFLAGRYLESIGKRRTGDAMATLSSTKPSTGLLYAPTGSLTTEESVDFLEVRDTLLVPVGASPPLDGILMSTSPSTTFDESSLTGEARPVAKLPGDPVFAGTTNAGPAAAIVTVTHEAGRTMLDGIVGAVRDAMGKKAGIERLADAITGYFVPGIVGVAALTFGVWCLRGYVGVLPTEWIGDNQRNRGWALFAVQFGVAVLVVACPCGIGLAAPTAQLVGVGLAAQNGILSNGGGEAFQTISNINTVVLDKTGTLTTSKFTVSDHRIFVNSKLYGLVYSMMLTAEQASTHPLAVGVRKWCQAQLAAKEKPPVVDIVSSEEIPGRGLVTTLVVQGNKLEVAIGNESLMQAIHAEYASVAVSSQAARDLLAWQTGGKSVIHLSVRAIMESSLTSLDLPINSKSHSVLGSFGIYDPPRPEAATLIAELQSLGMDIWMISGDNTITARTVAHSIGIDETHVIGGALPIDKKKWVQELQNRPASRFNKRNLWWRKNQDKCIVAFVGDGINDAPALAQADVGLAMGTASAVALSTASFQLLTSNLLSLLTIHHLARATRHKILSNFVWASLYNVGLVPLAAGAFYPAGRTRLPPVWGAAAMAFSSVSVVMNSLVLRGMYKAPKAVREWNSSERV